MIVECSSSARKRCFPRVETVIFGRDSRGNGEAEQEWQRPVANPSCMARRVETDGWTVLAPPGWEPVAEVCEDLFRTRGAIVERINDQIRAEIEEFRGPSSVITRSDLAWSTGGGVANFLRGVAELTPPTEQDMKFQRLVGRRSVILGLPLDPLIASFQVGFRELWATLARRAVERGGAAPSLLLEHGSIVWERLVATTTAVAEGYKQEEADREAFETTTTAHFIEALENNPGSDEARTLAHELGFDPDGPFRVLDLSGPVTVGEVARAVAWKLVSVGCIASTARRGRGAVVIAQGARDESLTEAMGALSPDTAVGVGNEGEGPHGALASMREARLARAVSSVRGRASRFEEDWLLSMLLTHGDTAERLLSKGVRVARTKPHLADAVRAYADAEFSVAQSSARLRLSPSSQRYRLSRWRLHTGWDTSTFDGLARSLVAIDLAEHATAAPTHS